MYLYVTLVFICVIFKKKIGDFAIWVTGIKLISSRYVQSLWSINVVIVPHTGCKS